MIRYAVSGITAALAVVALAIGASSAAANADLTADYQFEKDFKSDVGGVKALTPEGPARACPPCSKFDKEKVGSKKQGVWTWPSGDGLRLDNAKKALGQNGTTYSIAMTVRLDEVDSYRKLVDWSDRTEDEGWYVYDQSLYPYDNDEFEYDKERIQAGKWRQIVLVRDGKSKLRGYVDGELIGNAGDNDEQQTLKSKVLHFLIDDYGTEQTGGAIARLRIWDGALSKKQVKGLGN